MNRNARIVFMTGGSGGIGKSTSARMLAHTLGLHDYQTCLVDGNAGQQSQRMFLNIDDQHALEYARIEDMRSALVKPRDTHGAFALLCGPADPRSPEANNDYLDAILTLKVMCEMIVVDADRIDGRQWDDPHSFAGHVIRPLVEQADARIVFRIGQTGSQLDDGLACLDAIQRPDVTLAIGVSGLNVKPFTDNHWRSLLTGLAAYGGVDSWNNNSLSLLTPFKNVKTVKDRKVGWRKGEEPAWLIEAAVWAGADRNRFTRVERNKSWVASILKRD